MLCVRLQNLGRCEYVTESQSKQNMLFSKTAFSNEFTTDYSYIGFLFKFNIGRILTIFVPF